MEMEPMFRPAMMGFNRDDVSNFIVNQSKLIEKQLAEKELQLMNLKMEMDRRQAELSVREESSHAVSETASKNKKLADYLKKLVQQMQIDHTDFSQSVQEGSVAAEKMKADMLAFFQFYRNMKEYKEKADRFDEFSVMMAALVSGGAAPAPGPKEKEPFPELRDLQIETFLVKMEEQKKLLERIQKKQEALVLLAASFQFDE